MRTRLGFAAVIALAAIAGGRSVSSAKAAPADPQASASAAATSAGGQPAPTAEELASGKQTFSHYCSACHGPKGTGGPAPEGGKPARDLTQPAFQDSRTDAQLFGVVHDGVPPDFYMEAWSDRLSDSQIHDVIRYVRTLRASPKAGPT